MPTSNDYITDYKELHDPSVSDDLKIDFLIFKIEQKSKAIKKSFFLLLPLLVCGIITGPIGWIALGLIVLFGIGGISMFVSQRKEDQELLKVLRIKDNSTALGVFLAKGNNSNKRHIVELCDSLKIPLNSGSREFQ